MSNVHKNRVLSGLFSLIGIGSLIAGQYDFLLASVLVATIYGCTSDILEKLEETDG